MATPGAMATRRALASPLLRQLPRARAPAPAPARRLAQCTRGGGGALGTLRPRARAGPAPGAGARAYSQPAAGSKVWGFDEIKKIAEDSDPKVVIVDAREPSELKSTGRIPGAVNIPITSAPDSFHVSDDEFEDRFGHPRPPRDQEVVFYCKAGVRSRAAAGLAREAGWTSVGEYPGSWLDWTARGGKVER